MIVGSSLDSPEKLKESLREMDRRYLANQTKSRQIHKCGDNPPKKSADVQFTSAICLRLSRTDESSITTSFEVDGKTKQKVL